jgi:hypothetical protein
MQPEVHLDSGPGVQGQNTGGWDRNTAEGYPIVSDNTARDAVKDIPNKT